MYNNIIEETMDGTVIATMKKNTFDNKLFLSVGGESEAAAPDRADRSRQYIDLALMTADEEMPMGPEAVGDRLTQPVCKAVSAADCVIDGDGVLTGYSGSVKCAALPEGITALGMDSFFGSALEAVSIPEGVTTVGNGAFWNSFRLAWVSLPNSLRDIGGNAFWNTALQTVIIPDGVEAIGGDAFTGCKKLRDVYLPASVREIGIDAFFGLKERGGSIHAPAGSYGEAYAREQGISVDDRQPPCVISAKQSRSRSYAMEDTTLVRYNGRGAALDIPDGVTVIGAGAFADCETVETVVLPHSVERIETGAFRGCSRLYRIIIPETVTDIAEGAFEACPMLLIDTMAGSCGAAYGDRHRIPVVTDGRYALRPAVKERAEQARRMAAAEEAARIRRQEEDRRLREAEEAERRRRAEEERVRREAEEAERRRKAEEERLRKEAEEAERRRKEAEERRSRAAEEAERRRKEAERRVREMAQHSPTEDSTARSQQAELALRRNRYDDICSSIDVQKQIIAANSGLFGQQARNRRDAQKKLEALMAKRRKEFPTGRP